MKVYEGLKWTGAVFWGLAYCLFIAVGLSERACPLPWYTCAYCLSFEAHFALFSETQGSRLRNQIWFGVDGVLCALLLIYGNGLPGEVPRVTALKFLGLLALLFVVHFDLSRRASGALVRLFAWPGTLLIAVGMTHDALSRGGPVGWVLVLGAVAKILGDLAYALAHICCGLPVTGPVHLRKYYPPVTQAFILLALIADGWMLGALGPLMSSGITR